MEWHGEETNKIKWSAAGGTVLASRAAGSIHRMISISKFGIFVLEGMRHGAKGGH